LKYAPFFTKAIKIQWRISFLLSWHTRWSIPSGINSKQRVSIMIGHLFVGGKINAFVYFGTVICRNKFKCGVGITNARWNFWKDLFLRTASERESKAKQKTSNFKIFHDFGFVPWRITGASLYFFKDQQEQRR